MICPVCDGEIREDWDLCPYCNTSLHHSPKPSRWVLEMGAPNYLEWSRTFAQLRRKPLTASEYRLVSDFDRYLGRKGYLTMRQVEVLTDIARKHGVKLPPIPEASPDEVEIVKRKVLVRWRTFVPEKVIQTLIQHRQLIREQRERLGWTTIPNFPYPMPRQPEIEQKPEVFATAIDTDGWIIPRHRWGENKINRYKRYYERPEIGFTSTTLALTIKVANMMLTTIRPKPPRPPRRISVGYETVAGSSRAVHATIHAQPHLIKWKPQAKQILKLYREHPLRRLT